jgi:hypothetical protein
VIQLNIFHSRVGEVTFLWACVSYLYLSITQNFNQTIHCEYCRILALYLLKVSLSNALQCFLFFKKKLSLGRDSLWHAILQGNSVTEHDRETTSRNKDTAYSVARHGASDTKVLGLGIYVI